MLFWGTPDFALPSLRALEGEGHEVVGVVTQPDRPAGRGRKRRASPVRVEADAEGYPVLTPEEPRGDDFRREVEALEPEISVVVAYGHILRPEVLELPERGSVNVHASLLPELRGAAPVNWAIIRGHEETGVTVMEMVAAMDAGPVIHQIVEPIGPRETASELTSHLSEVGAEGLVEALTLLELGEAEPREQDDDEATYAPKIDRETARLDWSLPAGEVGRWIRGMDSIPGAWSVVDGVEVKLYAPTVVPDAEPGAPPGRVLEADARTGLVVAAGRGALRIGEVKPQGKRRMSAEEWIMGRGVEEGRRFE